MRHVSRFLAVSTLLLAASTLAARADTIDDFTLTSGANVVTFSLPASPIPDRVGAGGLTGFTIDSVPVDVNGSTGNYTISFFASASAGGLCISTGDPYCSGGDVIAQSGPVLYTGEEPTPTFAVGSYDLQNLGGPNTLSGNFHLIIAAEQTSPVPEPSSIALLGTGILGVAGAVRRKFLSA